VSRHFAKAVCSGIELPPASEEEKEEEAESYALFALLGIGGTLLSAVLLLWAHRHQQSRRMVAMYESLGESPPPPAGSPNLGFDERDEFYTSRGEEPLEAIQGREEVVAGRYYRIHMSKEGGMR